MPRAALGLRAHSGWAALVAIAGPLDAPAVLDRRLITIADSSISGSVQPYHTAERMRLEKADAYLKRCAGAARLLAREALQTVVGELRAKGHEVTGCGILLGSGRPAPALQTTLRSHALIHAAEGEFYREALRDASQECGLAVTGVKERELLDRAASALRIPGNDLLQRAAALGRSMGPPWRQDEKYAALAGWLALAAASWDK